VARTILRSGQCIWEARAAVCHDGGTLDHAQVSFNARSAIVRALGGRRCRAFSSDAAVHHPTGPSARGMPGESWMQAQGISWRACGGRAIGLSRSGVGGRDWD